MKKSTHSASSSIYTPTQVAAVDISRIPHHVAFIPDGNRRWAKSNNLSTKQGHEKGAETLMDTVKAAKELGIKMVTFYSFSTENWSRNPLEVQAIMWLLNTFLTEQRPLMVRDGIRLQTIGDLSRFSSSVRQTIQDTKDATVHCGDFDLVLALNYGGRDELRRAVQKICEDYAKKTFTSKEVTETLISHYLDTKHWNDPDLLIRTSGEQRMSNFLLWQTSYTEIYTTAVLWPDFSSQHLLNAILDFQKRQRRLGAG